MTLVFIDIWKCHRNLLHLSTFETGMWRKQDSCLCCQAHKRWTATFELCILLVQKYEKSSKVCSKCKYNDLRDFLASHLHQLYISYHCILLVCKRSWCWLEHYTAVCIIKRRKWAVEITWRGHSQSQSFCNIHSYYSP